VSPRRRALVAALGAALALLVVFVGVRLVAGAEPGEPTDQTVAGPVLLVPGYGGGTAGLEVLAGSLRAAGRTATVVPLPGDGTGDLALSVAALDAAAAVTGASPVDVVGYSAGGVVARLWAEQEPDSVRRVVTLGSPHHGTRVAALGAAVAPESCPVACRQLAPDSALLSELNDGDETPDGPQWLALWTVQDQVVTPPESARLEGAVNVELQRLCPGLAVSHGQLPVDRTVTAIVLDALSGPEVGEPSDAVCA
jgi:triacylglycerol lipase